MCFKILSFQLPRRHPHRCSGLVKLYMCQPPHRGRHVDPQRASCICRRCISSSTCPASEVGTTAGTDSQRRRRRRVTSNYSPTYATSTSSEHPLSVGYLCKKTHRSLMLPVSVLVYWHWYLDSLILRKTSVRIECTKCTEAYRRCMVRRFVFTHQVAALFCMKWRHGLQLEIMTYQKSDTSKKTHWWSLVRRIIVIEMRINPVILNDWIKT